MRGAHCFGFPPQLSCPSSRLENFPKEPAAFFFGSSFSIRGAAEPFPGNSRLLGCPKPPAKHPSAAPELRQGQRSRSGAGSPHPHPRALSDSRCILSMPICFPPSPAVPSTAESLSQPGHSPTLSIPAPSPTYLPSSSKSWYSSVKRLQVMVAIPRGWKCSLPVRSLGQAALLSLPPSPCAPGALSSLR